MLNLISVIAFETVIFDLKDKNFEKIKFDLEDSL